MCSKLRKKGVLVGGVAGEHSGYFSYLEVRKKNRDKFPVFAWGREVSFAFSYQRFCEFEGLRNQGMLQLWFQYQWKVSCILIHYI